MNKNNLKRLPKNEAIEIARQYLTNTGQDYCYVCADTSIFPGTDTGKVQLYNHLNINHDIFVKQSSFYVIVTLDEVENTKPVEIKEKVEKAQTFEQFLSKDKVDEMYNSFTNWVRGANMNHLRKFAENNGYDMEHINPLIAKNQLAMLRNCIINNFPKDNHKLLEDIHSKL